MNNVELLKILKTLLDYKMYVIIPICVGLFVMILTHIIKLGKTAKDETFEKYNTKQKETGKLKGMQKMMSQNGIMYRLHNYNLMPSSYLIVRLMISVMLGFLAFAISESLPTVFMILITGGAIVGGFSLSNVLFNVLNKQDNENMLMDIYNSYVALKTQLEAGQYIGDILQYIYENVSFDRYKQALKELIINMSDKTISSSEAIDIFRNRFDDTNIKKFCSVLNNYYIYGINDKFINNLTKEIESVIMANTMKEEESISRKVTLIGVVLFTVIMIIVVYCILIGFENISLF